MDDHKEDNAVQVEVTVQLEPRIVERITREADAIGVTPGEFVRFVLGSVATGRGSIGPFDGGWSPADILSPENMSKVSTVLGPFMREMMAGAGDLTCSNCTQRLTVADVRSGSCSHCEAPLEL